jgi:hypothetical protein
MRQAHTAGERLFVDYAGDGVAVVIDRLTGEIRNAQIFVAVLGVSSFTFAHASWTQTLPDWIDAHVRALEAIGGVPHLVVPDNTKTAVIKVLALIGIEDREAFEERDRAPLVAVAFRTLAFVIRNEAVGIDNRRAVLAFADIAANAQGLAEGEPILASESSRDDGVPEDKYIHAGVSVPRGCILRHGKRRLRRRRSPRLDPRHTARFQLGDDLIGDFGIKACPVVTGTSASG